MLSLTRCLKARTRQVSSIAAEKVYERANNGEWKGSESEGYSGERDWDRTTTPQLQRSGLAFGPTTSVRLNECDQLSISA